MAISRPNRSYSSGNVNLHQVSVLASGSNWEGQWLKRLVSSFLRVCLPQCPYHFLNDKCQDSRYVCMCLVTAMSDSLRPHGLQPAKLPCPWRFSRQEYWLSCPPPVDLFNPGLPHCRWILYCLSHQGSPNTIIILTVQTRKLPLSTLSNLYKLSNLYRIS